MDKIVRIKYIISLNKIDKEQLNGFFVGWKAPLTTEEHYNILKNSQYKILAVNMESNMVIGFINALSDKINFAFIPMLEVLPEFQNKGIGKELIRRMLKKLEYINCIDLTCDIRLQGFYSQFGMIESRGMVIRKYINQIIKK